MDKTEKRWLARRYCHGVDYDYESTKWQPCTDEQRERWCASGEPFEFKLAAKPAPTQQRGEG